MSPIRITGIVRLADHVRQSLSTPMTLDAREALAQQVEQSLRQIDAILKDAQATPVHLPTPSRRAYAFLRQANVRSTAQVLSNDNTPPAPHAHRESVRFSGLRPYYDGLLDDIARNITAGNLKTSLMLSVIGRVADRLDQSMARDDLTLEELRPESLGMLGWLRYFREPAHFEAYVHAVRQAQNTFSQLPGSRAGWRLPLHVHFRPVRVLYRWRLYHDGTRILLATPLIALSADLIHQLGSYMLGLHPQHRIIEQAWKNPQFQQIAAAVAQRAGVPDRTRGKVHDLASAYHRVNSIYFADRMARPRLRWSRQLTHRVFGHYCFMTDSVMISATLDQPLVPEFVVDHVLHHELLHKKHGVQWAGGQQRSHTPAFRAEERTFRHYAEAVRILDGLARQARHQ